MKVAVAVFVVLWQQLLGLEEVEVGTCSKESDECTQQLHTNKYSKGNLSISSFTILLVPQIYKYFGIYLHHSLYWIFYFNYPLYWTFQRHFSYVAFLF